MENHPPCQADAIYRVDAGGRLTFVNEGWEQFAILNDAPELCGLAVLGRRVADFIAGPETRLIFDQLARRAMTGARFTLPFRCDSPALRRRMSLAVARHGDEVEFRSHLTDFKLRAAVAVLDPQQPHSAGLLTMCSWCNRGRVGDRWAEIEVVVAELRLFEAEVPRLTHGICDDCRTHLSAELSA